MTDTIHKIGDMAESTDRRNSKSISNDAQLHSLINILSKKCNENDIDEIEKVAQKALSIAEEENRFHLGVVIQSFLGMAYFHSSDYPSALRAYRTGIDISRKAKAASDPAGPRLEIQCIFAEAATLLSMAEYGKRLKPT